MKRLLLAIAVVALLAMPAMADKFFPDPIPGAPVYHSESWTCDVEMEIPRYADIVSDCHILVELGPVQGKDYYGTETVKLINNFEPLEVKVGIKDTSGVADEYYCAILGVTGWSIDEGEVSYKEVGINLTPGKDLEIEVGLVGVDPEKIAAGTLVKVAEVTITLTDTI